MALLLDTCIVYDWLMDELRDASVREQVLSEGAYVSAVAVWEMAVKSGLGKLPLPTSDIAGTIEGQGFSWLPVSPHHAQGILELAHHHRDPFDRLLIAQATHEKMRLITYDAVFREYLPETWIAKK